MSSDYYGALAGELADRGADAEAAFLEWLNESTRREATGTYHDHLRAAFDAGAAYAARPDPKRRAAELCRPLMEASDDDLRYALILIGAEKRKRLRAFLMRKA